MKWFKDLLKGPGNAYWDLARVIVALSSLAMLAGAGWNVWLGLPIDLGPDGLGGGISAVLIAAAGLIYAKDKASSPNPPPKQALATKPARKKKC